MRGVLLGFAASIAALTVPAAPAQAQNVTAGGFNGGSHFNKSGGSSFHGDFRRDGDRHRDRDRRDRRRHRDFPGAVVLGDWGGRDDWDGNRSWDADRWNDWWHERPWRSYPRWVQSNQNCERMWWSGGGWRC